MNVIDLYGFLGGSKQEKLDLQGENYHGQQTVVLTLNGSFNSFIKISQSFNPSGFGDQVIILYSAPSLTEADYVLKALKLPRSIDDCLSAAERVFYSFRSELKSEMKRQQFTRDVSSTTQEPEFDETIKSKELPGLREILEKLIPYF